MRLVGIDLCVLRMPYTLRDQFCIFQTQRLVLPAGQYHHAFANSGQHEYQVSTERQSRIELTRAY